MVRSSSTKKLDHALVALADPTRRAILKRLTRGEARVTELARPFSVSLNAISKHIKLLERAGLVARRKVGREFLLARARSTDCVLPLVGRKAPLVAGFRDPGRLGAYLRIPSVRPICPFSFSPPNDPDGI